MVYHVFVDKDAAALIGPHRRIQGFKLDFTVKDINKLQILMPMHNLKAGIPRIALVIDNVKHKIWEV